MDRGSRAAGTGREGGRTRADLARGSSGDSTEATKSVKECRLSREAAAEVAEAAAWYGTRQPGLDAEFLNEVERVLPLIGSHPESFPSLLDTAPDLSIRRVLLPRFPYALVFIELSAEVRVIAVAHLRRHPGYWLNRIRA